MLTSVSNTDERTMMNSGEYLHSRDADFASSMTAQDVEGVEVPMNVDLPDGVAPWKVPADPWAAAAGVTL
jgi:hypothetical protein